MECPHGHVLVNNDLALPTEQVLFIGNYCTMFAHNDEIYINSYGIIYNYAIALYIRDEMYIKMRYKKCEMYMKVAKWREARIREFIEVWSKSSCLTDWN